MPTSIAGWAVSLVVAFLGSSVVVAIINGLSTRKKVGREAEGIAVTSLTLSMDGMAKDLLRLRDDMAREREECKEEIENLRAEIKEVRTRMAVLQSERDQAILDRDAERVRSDTVLEDIVGKLTNAALTAEGVALDLKTSHDRADAAEGEAGRAADAAARSPEEGDDGETLAPSTIS